jgi:hypothetical protein
MNQSVFDLNTSANQVVSPTLRLFSDLFAHIAHQLEFSFSNLVICVQHLSPSYNRRVSVLLTIPSMQITDATTERQDSCFDSRIRFSGLRIELLEDQVRSMTASIIEQPRSKVESSIILCSEHVENTEILNVRLSKASAVATAATSSSTSSTGSSQSAIPSDSLEISGQIGSYMLFVSPRHTQILLELLPKQPSPTPSSIAAESTLASIATLAAPVTFADSPSLHQPPPRTPNSNNSSGAVQQPPTTASSLGCEPSPQQLQSTDDDESSEEFFSAEEDLVDCEDDNDDDDDGNHHHQHQHHHHHQHHGTASKYPMQNSIDRLETPSTPLAHAGQSTNSRSSSEFAVARSSPSFDTTASSTSVSLDQTRLLAQINIDVSRFRLSLIYDSDVSVTYRNDSPTPYAAVDRIDLHIDGVAMRYKNGQDESGSIAIKSLRASEVLFSAGDRDNIAESAIFYFSGDNDQEQDDDNGDFEPFASDPSQAAFDSSVITVLFQSTPRLVGMSYYSR